MHDTTRQTTGIHKPLPQPQCAWPFIKLCIVKAIMNSILFILVKEPECENPEN